MVTSKDAVHADLHLARVTLLRAAEALPPGPTRGEIQFLARRCNDMLPRATDAIEGKVYECKCCHEVSLWPWGTFDAYMCGPCFNKGCQHERREAP